MWNILEYKEDDFNNYSDSFIREKLKKDGNLVLGNIGIWRIKNFGEFSSSFYYWQDFLDKHLAAYYAGKKQPFFSAKDVPSDYIMVNNNWQILYLGKSINEAVSVFRKNMLHYRFTLAYSYWDIIENLIENVLAGGNILDAFKEGKL